MDQDLIEVVGQTLAHRTEGLICAYLFGSRARGTQSPDSDVDIALLFERDPGARIRFEVRARNDYFDLLPHLRRYRRIDRGRAA
jgi:predicted nucleotidyltransferase